MTVEADEIDVEVIWAGAIVVEVEEETDRVETTALVEVRCLGWYRFNIKYTVKTYRRRARTSAPLPRRWLALCRRVILPWTTLGAYFERW